MFFSEKIQVKNTLGYHQNIICKMNGYLEICTPKEEL
jgi:hypothetical protein